MNNTPLSVQNAVWAKRELLLFNFSRKLSKPGVTPTGPPARLIDGETPMYHPHAFTWLGDDSIQETERKSKLHKLFPEFCS